MIKQYTFFYPNYGTGRGKKTTTKNQMFQLKPSEEKKNKLGEEGTKKQIINLSGMFPGH